MKTYPIHFDNPNEVTKFVEAMNQFNFDIDLRRGSVIIDAKSFLGVLTISGHRDLELVIHSNDCQDVLTAAESFLDREKTA